MVSAWVQYFALSQSYSHHSCPCLFHSISIPHCSLSLTDDLVQDGLCTWVSAVPSPGVCSPYFPCEGRSGAEGGFCSTSLHIMILLYNLALSAPHRTTSKWSEVERSGACGARTPGCSTSSLVGVPSRGWRRRQLPKPLSVELLFFPCFDPQPLFGPP